MRGQLLASLLILACSESPSADRPVFEVRDSSGVRIVENNVPVEESRTAWIVTEDPSLVIDTDPVNPDQVIHWIRGAVELSDGRIATISESSRELCFFDSAGVLLRVVGREGDGPGEFRNPYQLARLRGDTLVVAERGVRRISWFSQEGQFIHAETPDLAEARALGREKASVGQAWFVPPKSILLMLSDESRIPVGLRWRIPLQFVLADADGSDPVRVGSFRGGEVYMLDESLAGKAFFSNGTYAAFGGSLRRVYVGDSESFEFKAFDFSGRLLQITRDLTPREPILKEALRWERDVFLDWFEQLGGRERWVRFADAMPLPEFKPGFEDLVLDSDGYLWAKGYSNFSPEPIRYLVYSKEGERVGVVYLPGRFRITDVGRDFVLGVYYDLDGAESIRRYSLTRPVE
jgi:hypothetical protein